MNEAKQNENIQSTAGKVNLPSKFVLALLAFLVLNAWLAFYTPIQFDEFKFPYKGWNWWLMNDVKKMHGPFNVALLGSSLMVSANAGCDANYLNKSLDLANYHKSAYFEDSLKKKFGGSFNTVNLAAPGQMPSDAYLTLKAAVEHGNRPEVVVYGVAPRDFLDSTLNSPADTEPFKFLRRLVNIDDIAVYVFRNPLTKLDWWLQKSIFMYGYALDFQMLIGESAQLALDQALPKPAGVKPFTWWDRASLIPAYMPGEVHPEAVMANPLTKDKISYKDNTAEYRSRYKRPDVHTYKIQVAFLRKIIEYCHKERIELIVVNMPISLYNVALLPPGVYMNYLKMLSDETFVGNVSMHNAADFEYFSQEDFHDSVHLNAFGGRKFFDLLLKLTGNNLRSSTALQMAGRELERHQAIAAKRVEPVR